MSWQDKIKNPMIIVTGDGRSFSPFWLKAKRARDFNIAEFNFINVPGTYVPRATSRGNKYVLEVYFQGDDHLELAELFNTSADDSRAWRVTHPLFGSILVQPVSIEQDVDGLNTSKFTIPVIETIEIVSPRITVDTVSKIRNVGRIGRDALQLTFVLSKPTVFEVPKLQADVQSVYNQVSKQIRATVDASAYFNTFTEAYQQISNVVGQAVDTIRFIQSLIMAPVEFIDSVKGVMNMLVDTFNDLRNTVEGLLSLSDKRRYEQFAGVTVTAMCEVSVTNVGYSNRGEVLAVMQQISDSFDGYISDLDAITGDNGGSPDSFMPDQAAISEVARMVNLTLSNLYIIAFGAKKERTMYLDTDSNVILVAHRLYGLLPDDSTTQKIIDDNNIGLGEILVLKKGRAITYTV